MFWLQSIILWAVLPLTILLVVATIDAMTTVIKTTDQKYNPDKYVRKKVEVGSLSLRLGMIAGVEPHNKKARASAHHSHGLFASELSLPHAALACSSSQSDISSS